VAATRNSGSPGNGAPAGDGAGVGAGGSPAGAVLADMYRRLIQAMARPAEQARLLQAVTEEAAALARASAALLLPEPDDRSLLRVQIGTGLLAEREGELIPVDESFAGGALREGEPRVTPDLAADRRAFRLRERDAYSGPACAVPLSHGTQRFGVLLLTREPFAAAFTSDELELFSHAAAAFAGAFAASARFQHARAGREAIDQWRHARRLEEWQQVRDTADRASRRVVLRWEPREDRWIWGETLSHVFGHQADGFGATAEEWTRHLPEHEREQVRAELDRARGEALDLALRLSLRHQGGAVRRAELRIFAPTEHDFRAGALTDVTDDGRDSRGGEQNARAEAVAEIVRGLRHEINNPLSVVLGQLQLLEHDPTVLADPNLRDALRAMARESARIDELVRRLADLERQPREPFTTRSGGINFPDARR
jgi:hypothetical protein